MQTLLQKMQTTLDESVEWRGQFVFVESGAVLPLSVTLETVRTAGNLPADSQYNPRAVFQLAPENNACVMLPENATFRLVIDGRNKAGSQKFHPLFNQFMHTDQLRAHSNL